MTDTLIALSIVPGCFAFIGLMFVLGELVSAQIAHWRDGIPFGAIVRKQVVSKFGPSCPANGFHMMELRWHGWVWHERVK